MPLFAEESNSMHLRFTLEPLLRDQGIPLAIMGVLVVFAALVLVGVFIALLPRVMVVIDHLHPAQTEAAPKKKEPRRDPEELSEELVVVIAAAVAATLDHPHRVVRIRGLTPGDLGWSLEGRMRHHASHIPHQR